MVGSAELERYVKVWFSLDQDEDGWPPAGSEGLWGEPVSDGIVRIDNSPWFVRGIACDDLVQIRREDDGALWAAEKVKSSGRCTIRIVPFEEGPLRGSMRAVLDTFAPSGVTGEGIEQFGIIALDVPLDADLAAVQRLLRRGSADGSWDYEEACITNAWLAAAPD